MINRTLFTLFLMTLAALAACTTALGAEPTNETAYSSVSTPGPSDPGTNAEKVSVAKCPEAAPGAYQLISAARGICFLYPDNFDVFENSDGSGFTLYVSSLLNHEAPVIWFAFEPANGRSLEEVTAQRLADYAFPDTQSQAITLGGEPGSMLDNLPGQDINRRIVAIHDDRVIDIVIDHIGKFYGAAGEQAEAVYSMITSSLQFIGIEPEAPLLAGPECPEPIENSTLYTDERAGYCLLVPAAYTVQEINPEASEMAFFVGTIQDVTHPRLFIAVEDAAGRSVDEIVADKEAEIERAMPGLDVIPSFGHMLDGVPASQFDQVPGQDLSRQVMMVHNGRLYSLVFIPDDPTADAYAEMQNLYDIVIDSFSFTFNDKDREEASPLAAAGSIFGWVWHDICDSGKDGEPSPTSAPAGCIEATSPLGSYRADGEQDALEPPIPGIVVRLGEGMCPAIGLAEFTTIATDISYSFTGLTAGTYCISINPSEEPNLSILRPGIWTYPEVSEGTINRTVTLNEGQNIFDINFGWDYQFHP
jgi:hypothetical protein